MATNEQLYGYARWSIEWAFTAHNAPCSLEGGAGCATQSGSKVLLPPWAFDQTPIVRAVNALPEEEKAIVRFVAGLSYDEEYFKRALVHVWFQYFRGYASKRKINGKTLMLSQHLVEYAVVEYKHQVQNLPRIKTAEIMTAVECSDESNFRKHWVPRLFLMKQIIRKIETGALHKVIDAIDSKRRAKKHA